MLESNIVTSNNNISMNIYDVHILDRILFRCCVFFRFEQKTNVLKVVERNAMDSTLRTVNHVGY